MNKYFQVISIFILVLLFCLQKTNACSITLPPLRKEFRDSKNVFTGEVSDISHAPKNLKESKGKIIGGIVKFKIQKRVERS